MVSYIDNLQLPQVLYTLQCSVTTWQKVGQIFMQAKAVQPGGKGCAAITAQCLHLHWRERHEKKTGPVVLGCSNKIRMRKMQKNFKCVFRQMTVTAELALLSATRKCFCADFATTLPSILKDGLHSIGKKPPPMGGGHAVPPKYLHKLGVRSFC